jgi:Flp pilus assembly pilin Flp
MLKPKEKERGQTAVEYLLLIAAMIAFVALITYIIKTQVLR